MAPPIVVTGAASGLGASVAARLRAEARTVIGVDRQPTDVVADLGTPEGRRYAVAQALDAGDGAVAGVVSCAAVSPLHPDPATVVSVNLFGALAVVDGLRRALERASDPAAVVVSSIGAVDGTVDEELLAVLRSGDEEAARAAADDGTPYRSAIVYSTAKRALALAVRERAGEWGTAGVRLNAVAPGRMETPMLEELLADPLVSAGIDDLPVGTRASAPPELVAGAVCFLLGPDAGFVHGQVLFVDGGTEALMRPEVV